MKWKLFEIKDTGTPYYVAESHSTHVLEARAQLYLSRAYGKETQPIDFSGAMENTEEDYEMYDSNNRALWELRIVEELETEGEEATEDTETEEWEEDEATAIEENRKAEEDLEKIFGKTEEKEETPKKPIEQEEDEEGNDYWLYKLMEWNVDAGSWKPRLIERDTLKFMEGVEKITKFQKKHYQKVITSERNFITYFGENLDMPGPKWLAQSIYVRGNVGELVDRKEFPGKEVELPEVKIEPFTDPEERKIAITNQNYAIMREFVPDFGIKMEDGVLKPMHEMVKKQMLTRTHNLFTVLAHEASEIIEAKLQNPIEKDKLLDLYSESGISPTFKNMLAFRSQLTFMRGLWFDVCEAYGVGRVPHFDFSIDKIRYFALVVLKDNQQAEYIKWLKKKFYRETTTDKFDPIGRLWKDEYVVKKFKKFIKEMEDILDG